MTESRAFSAKALLPLDTVDYDGKLISAIIFVLIGGLLGGGGSRFPMQEMAVQLAALAALYFAFYGKNDTLRQAFRNHQGRASLYFLMAVGLIVVVQLIPLPPSLWQALPGRENLAEAAVLIGDANGWRPISIDPDLTIVSFLALIVPISAFLVMQCLSASQQRLLLWVIVLVAFVNLAVGMMQAFSGGSSFYLYDTAHKGMPIGLFGNRNHMGMLMLLGMIISASLLFPRARPIEYGQFLPMALFILAFLFGIIATNSRSIALLSLVTIALVTILSVPAQYRKWAYLMTAAAVLGLSALVAAMSGTGSFGILSGLVARFDQVGDHRYEFWPNAVTTMFHYFPFGSGIGTFDTAYRSQETLEILGTHYVNHAHNEYIEIGIETGLSGMVLLFCFSVWLWKNMARAVSRYRGGARTGISALFAGYGIICLMLHSLVDYPARSLSIAMIAGMLAALLAGSEAADQPLN